MGLSRKPWHDIQPLETSSTGRNGRCTESYSFLRGLEQEITWMTSFWETPVTPRTLPAQGNSTPCLSITPSTPCRVTERVQVKSKTRLGKTRNPTKSRSLASFLLLHWRIKCEHNMEKINHFATVIGEGEKEHANTCLQGGCWKVSICFLLLPLPSCQLKESIPCPFPPKTK